MSREAKMRAFASRAAMREHRRRCVSRYVGITLLIVTAVRANAQQGDSAAGLTLLDAARTAIGASPTVLLARQQLAQSEGAFLSASGQFDPQLQSSLLQSHQNALAATTAPGDPLAWGTTGTVAYDLTVPRLLRSGILVTPDVSITRTSASTAPGFALSQAALRVSALIPLWKDRGGAVTRTAERAARLGVKASTGSLRQGIAQGLFDAVVAYWNYREAQELLTVFQSSEQRADRMVTDTKTLVDADERTAADLTQARADLAAKRTARFGAEQSLVQARQQLGLALGLDASAIAALPPAVTSFPQLPADTLWTPPDSLVSHALAQRGDYLAAAATEQATQVQLAGARADLRGRFDLLVGIGYTGLKQGFGVDRFLSSIYQDVPGLNATLQVRYQLPIGNATALGREVESEAVLEQQHIVRADLARRVTSGVAVAIDAVRNAQLALRQSEEGASLSRATVKSERRKFQLGLSTLFEVIQAQDALTNAEVTQLDSKRNWSVAIVTLRFQAGTLIDHQAREATIDARRLLSPP